MVTEYRRQTIRMDHCACPCCRADGTKRQIRRIAKKRDRRAAVQIERTAW